MVAFSLSLYGLVVFPRMLGYIEMVVVDRFKQIQHGSNPSLAILAKTFRSLSYCHHNQEGHFLGCAPLLYIWIRSHILCEGITFIKYYFLRAASPSSARILSLHQRRKNGGFHLSKIQASYNGWPHGSSNPLYCIDVGTYLGYLFSDHGE